MPCIRGCFWSVKLYFSVNLKNKNNIICTICCINTELQCILKSFLNFTIKSYWFIVQFLCLQSIKCTKYAMFLSHWMTNTNTRTKLQIYSATWQSKPGSLCPNSSCSKLEKSSFLKVKLGNYGHFLAEENNILEIADAVEDYVKFYGQILKYRVWCLALFFKDILAGLNIWIHVNLDINLFNLEIICICAYSVIMVFYDDQAAIPTKWLFML